MLPLDQSSHFSKFKRSPIGGIEAAVRQERQIVAKLTQDKAEAIHRTNTLVDGRLEPVGHQVGVEDVVTFYIKSLPGIFQGQFILAVGAVISL